ncbi:uncharacterized protein METZ01_LOCUS419694, partial [marine metagenome]
RELKLTNIWHKLTNIWHNKLA